MMDLFFLRMKGNDEGKTMVCSELETQIHINVGIKMLILVSKMGLALTWPSHILSIAGELSITFQSIGAVGLIISTILSVFSLLF